MEKENLMGVIKVLSESVANKIAAGEVIERPASIVKELVENALDAGAKNIEVAVRHGGKSIIRVSDDGCGMNPEDAELAFKRYATSKISKAADLVEIASFGFRGEALPSIAAVSRVRMVTRTPKASTATEVVIEGGKLDGVKECAGAKGTVIEVRDLFFNTPARRKFLKSDTTEAGQIEETVSNLALSRRDVGFKLISSDKVVFDLLAGESLAARAATLLGKDLAKSFIEIEAEASGLKIKGLIGKPAVNRANRSGQIFFINKRWVRPASLAYGLQAGYHGLLMHGQFPVAVLFLDVDLSRVDVNVHPTKLEVRLSGENDIKEFIKETVSKHLGKESDLAPSLKAPASRMFGTSSSKSSFSFPELSLPPKGFYTDSSHKSPAGIAEPTVSYPAETEILPEPIALRDNLRITKILGQIHNTFIVTETEEGFMLIDQHAAHEKVMYESLVKSLESGKPASQRLLMEEVVDLPEKHKSILKKMTPLLEKTGFDIEPFGPHSFVVRAVPSTFEGESAAAVLKAFLEQKEDGKVHTDLEHQKEEIAALIACKKKSVRAFEPLTLLQIQSLLKRLALCKNPFACPHGRPSIIKYSFLDLEKQFKRK